MKKAVALLMAALLAISLFGCKAKENTPDDISSTGDSSSIVPGAAEQGSSQTEASPAMGTSTQSQGTTFEPQNTPTTGAPNPGNNTPSPGSTTSIPSANAPTTPANAKNVTITYNANGGKVSPSFQTVAQGSNVTLPTPTRSGFRFDGWYNGQIGGIRLGGAGDSYRVNATTTLFAQWTNKTTSLLDLHLRGLAGYELPVIKTDLEDAFGHKYVNTLLCTTSGRFRSASVRFTYDLDQKYNTFSATVAKYTSVQSNGQFLIIFGDNKPIYQNIKIHETTKPFNISIDVTNVKELRFEMEDQWNGVNSDDARGFLIANPVLLIN